MTNDLKPPHIPRYGFDAPIEMLPKSRAKFAVNVDVDAYFTNPALLDAMKKGEEEMLGQAQVFIDAISEIEDDAFFALVGAGVSIDRMKRWVAMADGERGILVDDVKACTISTKFVHHEERYSLEINTTWHGEWRRLR